MANPQNLRPKPFTSENNPGRGRPKGVKNRATILKKWLEAKVDHVNPITRTKERGTIEDEVIWALIAEARKGNVRAIQEIQDTLHGKLANNINLNVDELDREFEAILAGLDSRSQGSVLGEAESEAVN